MGFVRAALITAVLLFALGAEAAVAAPPPNDDFLSAIRLETGSGGVLTPQSPDTTQATTQPNLLGQFGTGPPEPTSCQGASFGKTVWYVFRASKPGVVDLRLGGFDAAVALYGYDPATSTLGRRVDCSDVPGNNEDLFAPVSAGQWYAIQVGGADRGGGPASGTVTTDFVVYGDADRDGTFDDLDSCPRRPGIKAFAGCPPRLNVTAPMLFTTTANVVMFKSLGIAGAPRGARIELRCRRRCAFHKVIHVPVAGTVGIGPVINKPLGSGASFELRVTATATAGRRYQYGAYGAYFRFDVSHGTVRRTTRCLLPGSRMPRLHCR